MTKVSVLPKESTVRMGMAQRVSLMTLAPQTTRDAASQGESDLYGDVVGVLAYDAPEKDPMPESRIVNAALIEWMKNSPQYDVLAADAMGNLPVSLVSGSVLWEIMADEETVKEALAAQEELEQAQQDVAAEEEEDADDDDDADDSDDDSDDDDDPDNDPDADDDDDGDSDQDGGDDGEGGDDPADGDGDSDGDSSDGGDGDADSGSSDASGDDGDGGGKSKGGKGGKGAGSGAGKHGSNSGNSGGGGGGGKSKNGKGDGAPDPSRSDAVEDPNARETGKVDSAAKQRLAQAMERVGQALDKVTSSPKARGKLHAALGVAGAKGKEVAAVMNGFGVQDRGAGGNGGINPADVNKFLASASDRIAKIAKVAGRVRNLAFSARANKVVEGMIPVDSALTQDVLDLHPTELAMMSPLAGALQYVTALDYIDNGLLGIKRGGEAESQGSFVAAVDISGSMSGDPIIIAKAVALGLAQTARAEGREYSICDFDTRIHSQVSDRDSWETFLKWANADAAGGTAFEPALEWAQKTIEKGFAQDRADALIITDGEAPLSDAAIETWKLFRETTGVRLIVVGIGIRNKTADRNPLVALSDVYIDIARMDYDAGDLIAQKIGALI